MAKYIYCARDTITKKLVSDITNPRRKYWDNRGNAENAINYYNKELKRFIERGEKCGALYNKGKHNEIELVVFELVEVEKNVK